MPRPRQPASPFRYFNSSPEVIRLAVLLYVKYPLSLRNVEDLLAERGIDISHETVRYWWNRFGPLFAGDIRRQRVSRMRGFRQWRWHLDEMYVKVNGEMRYLWRAVAPRENGLGDKAGCFAICTFIALGVAALLVIGLNAEPSDQLAEKIHTMPGWSN